MIPSHLFSLSDSDHFSVEHFTKWIDRAVATLLVCFLLLCYPPPTWSQTDLRQQAVQQHVAGQLNRADQLYRQVLNKRRNQSEQKPSRIAESLTDLAQIAIDMGKLEKAETLLQQALQQVSASNTDSILYSRMQHALAETYYRQGLLQQALELFNSALRLRKTLFRANHPLIAESLNGKAMIYYAQQDFAQARQLLAKARRIYANSSTSATLADTTVLNNLGLVALSQSDYAAAIQHLQQALLIQQHILPDKHPAIAECLHNLASVYFEQNLFPKATKLLKISLALSNNTTGYKYPSKALSLDMLSVINNILGRYAEALDYSRLATALYLQRITSNTARPLLRGAFAEHRSIQYLFEHHLDALIELKKYRNQPDDESYQQELFKVLQLAHISTSGHALLTHHSQSRHSARSSSIKGTIAPVSLRQTQRHLAADEAMLVYFLGWNQSYVMLIGKQKMRFLTLTINQNSIQQWLTPLLASLQNPTATRISEIKAFDIDSAYQLYQQLLQPLHAELKHIKHLLIIKDPQFEQLPFSLLVTQQPRVDVQRFTQFSAYRQVNWLIKEFAVSELPGIRALSILRAPTIGRQPKKRYIAFGAPNLSDRQKSHYNISQSSPQNQATLVTEQRKFIANKSNKVPKLRYNTSQSSPQSEQFALPLKAKPAIANHSKTDHRHYNVSQSSPHNQQALIQPESKPVSSLNRQALLALPRLDSAKAELEQLARLLHAGNDSVSSGKHATEANLKNSRLSNYQILAFATHGLTEQQTAALNGPAQASLLLTPPQNPSEFDDGLLTAEEIAQLDLNADWVILSACNTGVNDPISLSGLARAFFLAGSRSLLVSYWNLETEAARKLSTGLFNQIAMQPKIRRAEALRRSMLGFLENGTHTYYAHPYFWAPFAIIGEGGSLRSDPWTK